MPSSSAPHSNEPNDKTSDDDVAAVPEHKLHVSRVPTKFNEEIVKRILEDCLEQPESVVQVELVYPPEEDEDGNPTHPEDQPLEHRGFGFVCLQTPELLQQALALQTIKGGRKSTSTRKHTMHLRPYVANDETDDGDLDSKRICYLWSQNRCPYGEECKFLHSGEGGCLEKTSTDPNQPTKKRGKCFAFKTRGKCERGDNCPFSHEDLPEQEGSTSNKKPRLAVDKSEKDCINWKTKGKCRKGDKCEYRHDPEAQKLALEKKQKKSGEQNSALEKKQKKQKKKNTTKP